MKKLLSLLLALLVAFTSFSTVLADTTYTVQRGDTLWRIAQRFGVTVQALRTANGLSNANLIYAGQILRIPDGAGTGTPPPTTAPWTGQYVVQRGDTLWRIAQRFATTVDALKTANNLRSNIIYTGQILKIPGAVTPAPVTPPPPTVTVTPPPPPPCAINWFFNPRPFGCPAEKPLESHAAAQRFERGLMIWVGATDTYYAFHNLNDLGVFELTTVQGPLKFKPGAHPDNRVGGAPAGLMEPISGFGLLWRGEVEGVSGLRERLGWAVEPEYAFQTVRQCEAYASTSYSSPNCYVRTPYGTTYFAYYLRYWGYYWKPVS